MSEPKKCCVTRCNNYHTKKTDKYCTKCRYEYQKQYRFNQIEAKLEIALYAKFEPKEIPLIDETVGTFGTTILPLYWSDKSHKEWSTRYDSKNWEFNLSIHNHV